MTPSDANATATPTACSRATNVWLRGRLTALLRSHEIKDLQTRAWPER